MQAPEKILEVSDALVLLARLSGQWIVHLSLSGWDEEYLGIGDVCEALPFLSPDDHVQILHEREAVLMFDADEDAWALYYSLPSDDNPSPHVGALCYATIISPDAGLMSETT